MRIPNKIQNTIIAELDAIKSKLDKDVEKEGLVLFLSSNAVNPECAFNFMAGDDSEIIAIFYSYLNRNEVLKKVLLDMLLEDIIMDELKTIEDYGNKNK